MRNSLGKCLHSQREQQKQSLVEQVTHTWNANLRLLVVLLLGLAKIPMHLAFKLVVISLMSARNAQVGLESSESGGSLDAILLQAPEPLCALA